MSQDSLVTEVAVFVMDDQSAIPSSEGYFDYHDVHTSHWAYSFFSYSVNIVRLFPWRKVAGV
jgi:hypothetical protein